MIIEKGIKDGTYFKNNRYFAIFTLSVLLLVRPTAGKCGIASTIGCSEKRESQAKTIPILWMVLDNDKIFAACVTKTLKSLGIVPMRTSIRSPWQNGVAERWIGSCRRELLNHVIVLNRTHLFRLLREYVQYYNEDRTHYSLDKDPPSGRPILEKKSDNDRVIALSRVGGLHHKYVWKDAA